MSLSVFTLTLRDTMRHLYLRVSAVQMQIQHEDSLSQDRPIRRFKTSFRKLTNQARIFDEIPTTILQSWFATIPSPQSPLDDLRTSLWDLLWTPHVWWQQSIMRIAPGARWSFVSIWVRKAPKPSKKNTGTLFTVASNRSKLQANNFRKLHQKHSQGFLTEKNFPVEFLFRDMPSDGQIHLNLHRDGCYFVLIPSPILSLTRNRDSGGRFRHEF